MRIHVSAWVAAGALALAAQAFAHPPNTEGVTPDPNAPGSGHDAFVSNPTHREVTVTGTVVREHRGELVLRTDDNQSDNHHHLVSFRMSGSVAGERVKPGSHVALTYHPTGETGQAVDTVHVLEPPHARGEGRG
ncbi:MAG TPA: hypothetical protein VMX54_13130 [Vicinamibacteria bacterium]|nr:hypothetical protein [Vicinamibacteria bacterium]